MPSPEHGLRWKRTEYFQPSSLTERFSLPGILVLVLVFAAAATVILDLGPLITSSLAALAAVVVCIAGFEHFFPGKLIKQKPACALGADGIQFPDGRFVPWTRVRYVEPEQLPSATQNTSSDTMVIGIDDHTARVRVTDPLAFILDASQRRAFHKVLQNDEHREEFKTEAHVGYRAGIRRPSDNLVRVALDVSKEHESRLEAYARLDSLERESLFESLADETFRESLDDIQ
jgi:hypothetical protein